MNSNDNMEATKLVWGTIALTNVALQERKAQIVSVCTKT
jgi:hypothetical protein